MIMCRYLSFTDTAEHFYTTQPTVSKRIAALERALGVKLFNRGYRSVTLTEAGKILYQYYLRKNGMLNEALKRRGRCKKSEQIDFDRIAGRALHKRS